QSVWSIWFHVTDPDAMMAVQVVTVLVSFLFLIGFCTRLTGVLTWLAALSYCHRAPASLFGADTMVAMLLLYLNLGPCGAVLSVGAAGLFTLFFEIGYAYLIWRPRTRWLMLWMAFVLHGFIGVFMGLKTFSLMMLTLNLAFVPAESLRRFGQWGERTGRAMW